MPQIFDQNPNQLTGGKNCLYCGEGSRDCGGPFMQFDGRRFGPTSPLLVICSRGLREGQREVEQAIEKGQVQRLPGRSRREGVPDDPRRKNRRPAVTAQPDSPTLTQDQLAEAIKPPKRKSAAKAQPAAKAVVESPPADDTPDI